MESYTADDPRRFVRRIDFSRCEARLLARARRVLGWDADDLYPRAAGDVHRVHHLPVLHLRVALHEDDLLRSPIVDLLQPRPDAILGDLLGVDAVGTVAE